MKPTDFGFFANFLRTFFDRLYENDQIDWTTCNRMRKWLKTPEAKKHAQQLFHDESIAIPAQQLILQLRKLREMDGKEFNHIQVVSIPNTERPRRRCFVGHRFSPAVERTLRWNLHQVLEPYNVELDWSGKDIRSVQILDDILKKIREADFCVFDKRGAERKPNVYIEAGMCIALEKPFILFEHKSHSPRRSIPASIPSNLSHALSLRYGSYKQLFRDFHFRLPVFFAKNMH